MLPTSRTATQESPGLCPVRSGVENAMVKHVMPFAVILLLGSLVGFLAMLRSFLDGEVFDAGTMVRGLGSGVSLMESSCISFDREHLHIV